MEAEWMGTDATEVIYYINNSSYPGDKCMDNGKRYPCIQKMPNIEKTPQGKPDVTNMTETQCKKFGKLKDPTNSMTSTTLEQSPSGCIGKMDEDKSVMWNTAGYTDKCWGETEKYACIKLEK